MCVHVYVYENKEWKEKANNEEAGREKIATRMLCVPQAGCTCEMQAQTRLWIQLEGSAAPTALSPPFFFF